MFIRFLPHFPNEHNQWYHNYDFKDFQINFCWMISYGIAVRCFNNEKEIVHGIFGLFACECEQSVLCVRMCLFSCKDREYYSPHSQRSRIRGYWCCSSRTYIIYMWICILEIYNKVFILLCFLWMLSAFHYYTTTHYYYYHNCVVLFSASLLLSSINFNLLLL